MTDRENVIKGLECHQIDKDNRINCSDCPYHCDEFMNGLNELHNDAIALLKEQEAVKPHYNARTNWYECGDCHYSMTSGMHCRCELIPAYKVGFCAKCGKGVNWE